MRSSSHKTPDIIVVPANPVEGAGDYAIGDMHGNCEILLSLMETREKLVDRIFAAGDLVDRGLGNVELIRAIVNNNEEDKNGKIYAVRGNHEDMCVNAIDALIWLTDIKLYCNRRHDFLLKLYILKKQAKSDPAMKAILADKVIGQFLGGALLLAKSYYSNFFKELQANKKMTFEEVVAYLEDGTNLDVDLSLLRGNLAAAQEAIRLHQINGGQWLTDLYVEELTNTTISETEDEKIEFADTSVILMLRNYLETLPYIIRVEGKIPFNVVHGDMPMNDEDLLKRIADGGWLTDEEKEYAMWARPFANAEIKITFTPGRDKYSILTITGHTIDGGVRRETNTINLDVSSYSRNQAIVVKMPECSVSLVMDNDEKTVPDKTIMRIAKETQQQLDRQVKLQARREKNKMDLTASPRLFNSSKSDVDVVPVRRKPGV